MRLSTSRRAGGMPLLYGTSCAPAESTSRKKQVQLEGLPGGTERNRAARMARNTCAAPAESAQVLTIALGAPARFRRQRAIHPLEATTSPLPPPVLPPPQPE